VLDCQDLSATSEPSPIEPSPYPKELRASLGAPDSANVEKSFVLMCHALGLTLSREQLKVLHVVERDGSVVLICLSGPERLIDSRARFWSWLGEPNRPEPRLGRLPGLRLG
jgi:hypothetical protein